MSGGTKIEPKYDKTKKRLERHQIAEQSNNNRGAEQEKVPAPLCLES
jgi:hypothetical protein